MTFISSFVSSVQFAPTMYKKNCLCQLLFLKVANRVSFLRFTDTRKEMHIFITRSLTQYWLSADPFVCERKYLSFTLLFVPSVLCDEKFSHLEQSPSLSNLECDIYFSLLSEGSLRYRIKYKFSQLLLIFALGYERFTSVWQMPVHHHYKMEFVRNVLSSIVRNDTQIAACH